MYGGPPTGVPPGLYPPGYRGDWGGGRPGKDRDGPPMGDNSIAGGSWRGGSKDRDPRNARVAADPRSSAPIASGPPDRVPPGGFPGPQSSMPPAM